MTMALKTIKKYAKTETSKGVCGISDVVEAVVTETNDLWSECRDE